MRSFLAITAMLACCSGTHAQLQLEKRYALGEPIVATAQNPAPKNARVAYDWRADSKGCTVVPLGDGRTAHIWACPGKHTLDLVVAVAGEDSISVVRYERDFLVIGSGPSPSIDTLADLVSVESAEILAEFHSDWSQQLDKLSNRNNFDKAYLSTRTGLNLADTEQAYAAIDARLDQVRDFPDALAAELLAIAEEFGGEAPEPTPPPEPDPTSGQRIVLIVHETQDDTPDFSRVLVQLRSGTEADYLKKQGHKLYILDDDTRDTNGQKPGVLEKYDSDIQSVGLPAMLVIDPKTEKLIKSRRLQEGVTASNVTEYIRQAGG